MVLQYYGLRENPFGVTLDSRYLFLSDTHREAVASLLYGVEAGCGFVAMLARPGLGKTTLLFHTLNFLRDKVTTVFLFQTICTPIELLRAVLADLGVSEISGPLIELQSKLHETLAEQFRLGRRVVIGIDEAQNLDDSVLELVRMISNFETSREKLLQIILSGQPQLAEKIASPHLIQLRQRVSIFAKLVPFTPEDTQLYIDHRLRTAGYGFAEPLFTKEAMALIARNSEGVPRNINNLCFNSLSLGCALKQKTIKADTVREVIDDLDLDRWRNQVSFAVPLKEDLKLPASPFPSVPDISMKPSSWRLKLAVGALVAFTLSVSLYAGAGGLFPEAAPLAHREAHALQPPSKVSSDLPEAPKAALPAAMRLSGAGAVGPTLTPSFQSTDAGGSQIENPPTSTVRVMPGWTLLGIWVKEFGVCNQKLLKEIHSLNPRLKDPDHIESGQKIRIPLLRASESVTEQPRKASLSDRGVQ